MMETTLWDEQTRLDRATRQKIGGAIAKQLPDYFGLEDVAKLLHVSRERVRQIQNAALFKVAQRVNERARKMESARPGRAMPND